jgi:hypothetical protein
MIMADRIAVLYDENNQTADVFHLHHITIYEKNQKWEETTLLSEVSVSESKNIRSILDSLIYKIKDCKVIVGRMIAGMPYYMLDKNGFMICEAEECSEELLEQISQELFKEEEPQFIPDENVPKKPMPVDNAGNYYFNFALIQKNFPEISSKKALLPFFSHELFQSITIVCTHIMPWLDNYLKQMNLQMESHREDGLYTLVITHRLCSE